jgi:hypothetical protein
VRTIERATAGNEPNQIQQFRACCPSSETREPG